MTTFPGRVRSGGPVMNTLTDAERHIDHEIMAERRSGIIDRRAVHGAHCIAPETGLPACGSPDQHETIVRHPHGPLCAGLGLHRHVIADPISESEARALWGDR